MTRRGGLDFLSVPDEGDASRQALITVPADAGKETIHVILEVTDDGDPALTRYRRIIVDVARAAER